MRLIVTGWRKARVEHRPVIARCIVKAIGEANWHRYTHVLVHGDADGVDTIAADICENWGWAIEAWPADWLKYKQSAGGIRNSRMIARGGTLCLGFPGPGSIGTWDCMKKAKRAGIPVKFHRLL